MDELNEIATLLKERLRSIKSDGDIATAQDLELTIQKLENYIHIQANRR